MRKYICALIIIFCFAFGQYERPGSSAAQFLDIGVNPRAESMAGAFISMTSGAGACYYNPAALTMLAGPAFEISHTNWFADISHDYVAVALPFGRNRGIGLSFTSMITDEMIVRTPLQPDGTGETFFSGNYRFGVSMGQKLTDNVSLGVNLNYVELILFRHYKQEVYAGDVSVLYDAKIRNFKFGFKIANFGSDVKYIHESYPMPTSFVFGVSGNLIEKGANTIALSTNAYKPNDGSPKGVLGLEYGLNSMYFVRGGYHIDDPVKSFALGAGAKINTPFLPISVNYSITDYGPLGLNQRLGLEIGK